MNFQDELAYFLDYLEVFSTPCGDFPDEEKHGASSKATGPVKKPKVKPSPLRRPPSRTQSPSPTRASP